MTSCEDMLYDNAVYAEVSEKPASQEFTVDNNSCYAIPSNTGSKSSEARSGGIKVSCTKKLLLIQFLVVLVLMLGTICICVAFALEISNLKSKVTPINTEISSPVDTKNDFALFSASIQQLNTSLQGFSALNDNIQDLYALLTLPSLHQYSNSTAPLMII